MYFKLADIYHSRSIIEVIFSSRGNGNYLQDRPQFLANVHTPLSILISFYTGKGLLFNDDKFFYVSLTLTYLINLF